jgi:hypothetical protein
MRANSHDEASLKLLGGEIPIGAEILPYCVDLINPGIAGSRDLLDPHWVFDYFGTQSNGRQESP